MTTSRRGKSQLNDLLTFGGLLLLGLAIVTAVWLLVAVLW